MRGYILDCDETHSCCSVGWKPSCDSSVIWTETLFIPLYFETEVLDIKRTKCKLVLHISSVSESLSATEDVSHILQNTEFHSFVRKEHQVTLSQATRPGNQILMRGVPCSRSLIPGISPHWPRIDIRPVHVRFMMDKVALAQIFIWVLRLSPSSLPPYCTLIFIYMSFLQRGQTSKTWQLSERNVLSEFGKHWIEKYFHL